MTTNSSKEQNYIKRLQKAKGNEYELLGEYTTMKTKTKFKHLGCGYTWDTSPDNMLRSKKGCPRCAGNARVTTEDFIKTVRESVGDEYAVEGTYVNARKPIAIRHNVCGTLLHVAPHSFTVLGTRCKVCSNRVRLGIEKLNERLQEVAGEDYVFITSNGMNKPAICTHITCGFSWNVLPSNVIRRGSRCPKCAGNSKRTHQEFLSEVKVKYGNEYEILSEYVNSQDKVLCKHTCGHEWYISPNNLLRGRECPSCYKTSKGERLVANILTNKGILFETQKALECCVYKGQLLFDFYLPAFNVVIEYDGEQHFKPINFGGRSDKESLDDFHLCKARDEIKDKYCKANNIPLLRIPYTISPEDIDILITKFITV